MNGAVPPASVVVIVPALDEEASVGEVVRAIPRHPAGAVVTRIVVVDNGSRDATADAAAAAGAEVLCEPAKGYGRACLAGLAAVEAGPRPDIVAFLDADLSDRPEELPAVLAPILDGNADLVVGSRVLGSRAGRVQPGSLLPQARVGNAVATALVRARWGARFTDLGPFRAVRYEALLQLGMADPTYGWTVEMQAKAARAGLRCTEVPVSYRRRVGRSKITGTVAGSIRAGAKILWTIGRLAVGGAAAPAREPKNAGTIFDVAASGPTKPHAQ